MTAQLALCFDEVPITDQTQARYHAIAPCLAGKLSAIEQARLLNLSYQKVTRWLRDFRQRGMPALFPASEFSREPYTPERVIVTLLYGLRRARRCCATYGGRHGSQAQQIKHPILKVNRSSQSKCLNVCSI